jgi:NADH-quinone oxidoreductase subunit G
VNVSAQILLDRERCVLCARCTRFSEQISGDPFIALVERGALQQVGTYERRPVRQLLLRQRRPDLPGRRADQRRLPLPGAPVRPGVDDRPPASTARPAASCAPTTATTRSSAASPATKPEVNEEWNCDKGRFGFYYGRQADRLTTPLVREDGELRPRPGRGHRRRRAGLKAAGPTSACSPAAAHRRERLRYAKFARAVLGTNNIDFRSRPALARRPTSWATRSPASALGEGVTYADLENATRSSAWLRAGGREPDRLPAPPQGESARTSSGRQRGALPVQRVRQAERPAHRRTSPEPRPLSLPGLDADAGTVILVGERGCRAFRGPFSALTELADRTGARLAWIPRRAGDRGAVEAGCLPGLLPGGRPVTDAAARVDLAAAWGAEATQRAGLNGTQILQAAAAGTLQALVVAGSSPPTSPMPRPRATAWSRPGSWSASSRVSRKSPSAPTSCSRST